MKKIIILLITLVFFSALVSCAQSEIPSQSETQPHLHSFGEWVTTKTPTCTEAGERERTCSCGEKQTQAIAALGHDYSHYICTRCNELYPLGSNGLAYKLKGDSYAWSGYGTCVDDYVCIAKTYNGKPVTSIDLDYSIFKGFKYLLIPDSVTSIENMNQCYNLMSLTIPDSVTKIGVQAFLGCGFTEVTIGNGVTEISRNAFSNCSNLRLVKISDSVTSIGEAAFDECTNLTEIVIPNSVISIGRQAFYFCDKLANVIIGNGVKSIGDYAFHGCESLTGILIPDSVTSIGDYAFAGCRKLKYVTIGKGVKSIGTWAFATISTNLNYITYRGTKSQWNSISKGDLGFKGDVVIHCIDGDININSK